MHWLSYLPIDKEDLIIFFVLAGYLVYIFIAVTIRYWLLKRIDRE